MSQITYAPISIGELIDKITILEIKLTKSQDPEKLNNIRTEYDMLSIILNNLELSEQIPKLKDELLKVNGELWVIEESKRLHEKQQLFDATFILLARAVYIKNDIRANIKKQINLLTDSTIVEEKDILTISRLTL
jgi:hypothetical protein